MGDWSADAISGGLKAILGPEIEPVAVYLLPPGATPAPFDGYRSLIHHRYCQALMRARRGESVRLEPDELACPAAASAFGFRPLPAQLASGKGLVGFGIADHESTGQRMFEGMTRLAAGEIGGIAACPLVAAPRIPDVVIVEARPEPVMWLVLADLILAGGARRHADTAVLQAACVDSTIIPYREGRLNFALGCYGCRESTDLEAAEMVVGFPGSHLDGLLGALRYLGDKAVPRSRAKAAFYHLEEGGADRPGGSR